ncbi:unnamed protein product, partial [Prorocentrum cordatum]
RPAPFAGRAVARGGRAVARGPAGAQLARDGALERGWPSGEDSKRTPSCQGGRGRSGSVLCVAVATVAAYTLNSYVFRWIDGAAFTSRLFHLWLCHVGALLLSPALCLQGPGGVREALAEYRPGCESAASSLARDSCVLALFSMLVYYLWFLAASMLPGQLLAAIFQSSIAAMYLLSVLVLGERFAWPKA